jgi:tetrahydromethanopterin S-methyltransferase subunit E
MKSDVLLWQIIQAIVIGAGLLAYAHANFATKTELEKMYETVSRIDERVYKLAQKQGIE